MKQIILLPEQLAKLNKIIARHKSYSALSKDKIDAYEYVDTIGLKVCPYCNINYIYSVYRVINGTKIPAARADLDHFEPKSIVSKKSLDVYNLVPSCQQCNSRLKHQKKFSNNTHIHPFFDDFDSIVAFRVKITDASYINKKSMAIFISTLDPKNWDRASRNVTDFALVERYQQHKDEVVKLFKIISHVNTYRLREIASILGVGEISKSLLHDYADCDINNTSLGKLKKDIIIQYS